MNQTWFDSNAENNQCCLTCTVQQTWLLEGTDNNLDFLNMGFLEDPTSDVTTTIGFLEDPTSDVTTTTVAVGLPSNSHFVPLNIPIRVNEKQAANGLAREGAPATTVTACSNTSKGASENNEKQTIT